MSKQSLEEAVKLRDTSAYNLKVSVSSTKWYWPFTINIHRHYHLFEDKEKEPTKREKIAIGLIIAAVTILLFASSCNGPTIKYVPIYMDKLVPAITVGS